MRNGTTAALAAWVLWSALALVMTGCLSLWTHHVVEPIHITMDVNLKVDRELDRYFGTADTEVKP